MQAIGDRQLPIIVTGHLHTTGAEISELSERRIVIGGQEAVSTDIFPTEAAYVALGHLHKPQQVAGNSIIRYAGSPFPMSVAEKGYKHSVTLLDLSAGQAEVTLLLAPRPARFLRVPERGALPLDALEKELIALEATESDYVFPAYIEVAVRLDDVEPELRRRVEDALHDKPFRLTRIERQSAGDGAGLADAVGRGSELINLDPLQVFGQLYRSKYATEVPDELRKAFTEIVAAANDAGEKAVVL
jgi:exonuclease SbcD